MDTALFVYKGYEHLTYPPGHPFRPERASMLHGILDREEILAKPWLKQLVPPLAELDELLTFHSRNYIEAIDRTSRGEYEFEFLKYGLGSEDCPVFQGLFELTRLACGASLEGARALVRKEVHVAFNPIGGFHHAGPEYAEGFCYLNDVVIAGLELLGRGLKVAIVDLDVHHGNGTEAAFLGEPRALVISTHETGKTLYPWSGFETTIGEGAGRGYNINVPLPVGTDDQAFNRAVEQIVVPALRAFGPDVIVLEAGMDVLRGDPLAHFKMTNGGAAEAAGRIGALGLPMLVLGGGGYNPRSTARGWALVLMTLTDNEPDEVFAGAVGGVFIGAEDVAGCLRDMQVFATGREREVIDAEVERLIAFHLENTLPLIRES